MNPIALKNGAYQTSTKHTLLHAIDLQISQGELVVISGPSGGGKSTLLNLLNGLNPELYEGQVKGEGHIGSSPFPIEDFSAHVAQLGMVFQNPKTHFFTTDVYAELAFVMENYGYSSEAIQTRVDEQVNTFGLSSLREASMFHLSGGQRQLVSIAAANMLPHELLLLDEPASNLDPMAIQQLKQTLIQLKQQGKTILIAEHRLDYLMAIADRLVIVEEGTIKQQFAKEEFSKITEQRRKQMSLRSFNPISVGPTQKMGSSRNPSLTVEVEQLTYRYRKQKQQALEISHLRLANDTINGIIGDNGAGKTTLFEILAGLRKGKTGTIKLNGQPCKPKNLLAKAFLVMQDVNLQLFFETVEKELLEKAQNSERFEEICQKFHLTHLLQRHPHSLSGGEKQRVAIASALLSGKEILLFDEPTSGLDYLHMKEVSQLLQSLKNEPVIVLVISHDEEFLQTTCQTIVSLKKGQLVEVVEREGNNS